MRHPLLTSSSSLGAMALTALAFVLVPLACNSTPNITGAACTKNLQVACGDPCESTIDCGKGLYCGEEGTCIADCVAGERDPICESGVCSPFGQCPSGDVIGDVGDSGNDNGGAGSDGGDGAGCINVVVNFAPQVPTVLLLIDRSGSMDHGDGFRAAVEAAEGYQLGNCSDDNASGDNANYYRWNVVREVLLNPERGVVKPLESKVRFGLSLYTSQDGSLNDGTCPMMENEPIRLNNHEQMLASFRCSDFPRDGDTPTGPALLAAADILEDFDEPGPKLIVLATDGLPDDCTCPDFNAGNVPASCNNAAELRVREDVVTFAGQIQQRGIAVHVINVSNPGNNALQTHLAAVATAGGGNVYPGFNPGNLVDAFQEIIDGARSCKIDLDGAIAAGRESAGTISLNGQRLTLDGSNGWRVNNPRQIELLGSACETIKDGEHDLKIDFPCGAFVPPVTK